MSASACARASQKNKSLLSLERGGYGPRTGPMSGAERARRFRERLKAAKTRLIIDADSASTFTKHGTAMSGAERAKRYRERLKAAKAGLVVNDADSANTSTRHRTPLSGAERVRRYRERLKANRALLVNEADYASTSTRHRRVPTQPHPIFLYDKKTNVTSDIVKSEIKNDNIIREEQNEVYIKSETDTKAAVPPPFYFFNTEIHTDDLNADDINTGDVKTVKVEADDEEEEESHELHFVLEIETEATIPPADADVNTAVKTEEFFGDAADEDGFFFLY